MVCCLLCFSDDPIEGDKYGQNPNTFQVSLKDAACAEPACCIGTFFCPCCAQYYIRKKALNDDMSNYTCCQGYYDCACFKAGNLGESSCPELCLCLEAYCCESCAVSSTRMLVMDTYMLASDPWDRRIIRFNNFCQVLSCVCQILAMVEPSLQDCAELIRLIAECVYYSVQACMTSQVHHELKYQADKGGVGGPAGGGGSTVVAQPVTAQPAYATAYPQGGAPPAYPTMAR